MFLFWLVWFSWYACRVLLARLIWSSTAKFLLRFVYVLNCDNIEEESNISLSRIILSIKNLSAKRRIWQRECYEFGTFFRSKLICKSSKISDFGIFVCLYRVVSVQCFCFFFFLKNWFTSLQKLYSWIKSLSFMDDFLAINWRRLNNDSPNKFYVWTFSSISVIECFRYEYN